MEIKKFQTPSFKGYDARVLKGLFATDKACADSIKRVTKDIGIDVFMPEIASKSIRKEHFDLAQQNMLMWAQDYFTFIRQKAGGIMYDGARDRISRILRACSDGVQKSLGLLPLKTNPHLRGGNFFVCDVNGKNKLLLLEGRDLYSNELFVKLYNVEEIHTIPRLDYHLDLFIRPLENGNVLVADNEMTKTGLKTGLEKISAYINSNSVSKEEKTTLENIIESIKNALGKMEITEQYAPYKPSETTPKVIAALENAGMNPIRVPGSYFHLEGIKNPEKEKEMLTNFNKNMERLKSLSENHDANVQAKVEQYIEFQKFAVKSKNNLGVELENIYDNNFLNSIAFKKDGKLYYITNASLLDSAMGITPEIEAKIGFSTKKMFLDSVSPYIERENVRFVDEKTTKRMFKYMGGIHCSSAEMV